MKNFLLFILVLLCLFSGCGKILPAADSTVISSAGDAAVSSSLSELSDYPPAVMVEGRLYFDTGGTLSGESAPTCGTPDGEFTSFVPQTELPQKDLQSNFAGAVSYQIYTEDSILVSINNADTSCRAIFSARDDVILNG